MGICGKSVQDPSAPPDSLSLRPDSPPPMHPIGLGFLRLAAVLAFYTVLYVFSLSIRDGTLLAYFIWRPGSVGGLGEKALGPQADI